MGIEYRDVTGNAKTEGNTLVGLVTPFGVETTIGDMSKGGFREQIAPGAFTKTLQERDVVLLFNHNSDMPLARTSAGNLSLTQAKDGLRATAEPVQTSYGKDLMDLTKAGVVRGMSFGFEVVKDNWTDDEGRASNSATGTRRTVQEVRLHEVSAVTFPAYQTTSVAVRDAVNAARGADETRGEFDWHPGTVRFDKNVVETCDYELSKIQDEETRNGSAKVIAERHGWTVTRRDDKYNADDLKEVAALLAAAVKRDAEKYNADDRKKAAASGDALPDGSFPIKDAEDLQNAIHLWGNASDPEEAKAHIIDRARALGLVSQLPDSWNVSEKNSLEGDLERRDATAQQAIAAVDAALDSAMLCIADVDRTSLSPEVNQFIDIVTAAWIAAGESSDISGVPDPDDDDSKGYEKNSAEPDSELRFEPDDLQELRDKFLMATGRINFDRRSDDIPDDPASAAKWDNEEYAPTFLFNIFDKE